jgi:hypothetical protein
VWTYFKFMCAYHGLEAVPNAGSASHILLRDAFRGTTINPVLRDLSQDVSDVSLAEYVTVNYYNNTPITNGQVYPVTSWEDGTVFSVTPGEVVETEIRVNAWLSSVNQPVVSDVIVGPTYDASGTNGVYNVAGADGLPVLASMWTMYGGRLSVALTDDPSVLKLTIVGPRRNALTERIGTFYIAATSGNTYSTLRITGTGVKYEQKSVDIKTGAGTNLPTDESGATVDNPFISTLADAYDHGVRTAGAFCGPKHSIQVITDIHNTPALVTGELIARNDSVYRARGVSQDRGQLTIDAEAHTRISHFNTRYTGMTFGQFNTANSGLKFGQYNVIPLRG